MTKIQIIGAGAGSGKTYRLAEEVFKHIDEENVPPDRILLATFTNAAAEELRSRVTLRLIEEGKFTQAQEIRQARMGTVNSVCGSIIEDFALEAGVPPAQKVIDDVQEVKLFSDAMSAALTGPRLEKLDRLAIALSVRGWFKKTDWSNDIIKLCKDARSNRIASGDLAHWASKSVELNLKNREPEVESRLAEMRRTAEAVRAEAQTLYPDGSGMLKKTQIAMDQLGSFLSSVKGGRLRWSEFKGLAKIDAGIKGTAQQIQNSLEPFSSMAAGFTRWKDFRGDIKEYLNLVFAVAAESLENYSRMKREAGLIDFTDQEVLCLDLLEDKSIAEKIGEQLDLVLIDEFQDTSPIQLALFLKFAELSKKSIWVGDPKQSIYIFRGAEPRLMLEAFKSIHKKGAADRQEKNYRSRYELVTFANKCFKEIFKTQGMEEEDVILEPDRGERELSAPALESWVLEGSNGDKRLTAMAAGILDLFKGPDQYPVLEKNTKKIRPLEYRDLGIMFRSNSECTKFAGLLKSFGIPAEIAAAGLLEQPEVRLCTAALRLFLNPEDRLAAATLTWFREVASDRTSDTDWLTARIQEELAGQRRAWDTDTCLQALRAEPGAAALPVTTALSRALELTGLRETVSRNPDPRAALANLEQLAALARRYEESEAGLGIAGFLDFLSEVSEREQDDMAAGSGNAVTVCTWHKAKGLEWPMVILGSLNKAHKQRLGIQIVPADQLDISNPLKDRGIIYLLNPYADNSTVDGWLQALLDLDVFKSHDKGLREEHLRMLYVALTRARDYMVFAAAPGKLQTLEVDTPDGPVRICEIPQVPEGLPDGWRLRTLKPADPDEHAGTVPTAAVWFPYADCPPDYQAGECAPSSFEHADTSGAGVSIAEIVNIAEPIKVTGNPESNTLGDAVHGYMAVNTSQMDDTGREKTAARILTAMNIQDNVNPSDLVQQSNALSDYITKTWHNVNWHRELALSVEINQVTINGYADLILDTKDGLVIIDHKSMTGTEDWLKAKALSFAPQLASYGEAASRAMKKPVLKTYIYYLIEGKLVEIEMKDKEKMLVEVMG